MGYVLTNKLHKSSEFVYKHWCGGCKQKHLIPVAGATEEHTSITARWSFNGNIHAPTFSPSIHIHANADWDGTGVLRDKTICHYFIVDGIIQYLGDCDHELAGQNVPMFDMPEPPVLDPGIGS
jgi:hypothetical protein